MALEKLKSKEKPNLEPWKFSGKLVSNFLLILP
jgi:hypothetical protein